MRLVDLVSQETGADFAEMMLLRHSTDSVEKVIACGASVEEWTSIHPTGTKYDFWATGRRRITLVVVIVRDQVFGVYRVVGIEAEGALYTLASETLRRSYIWQDERRARPSVCHAESCECSHGPPLLAGKARRSAQ